MLSLQGPLPEINFQDKSEGAHDKLLKMVQAHIPAETQTASSETKASEDKTHDHLEKNAESFQVCMGKLYTFQIVFRNKTMY